jgi:SAM-dependent methyltransferase
MAELRERFDALGPWFTSFEIDGEAFGGEHSYEDDHRVSLFFEWLGEPARILELASFEGAHSLQLASRPFVAKLLGLEARPESIKRAELAVELLGRGNVEFRQADLDNVSLQEWGEFDAVFCAGVLYHLTRPWRLIEEVARVTDRLFLDTHISNTDEVRVGRYAGHMYREGGYADPQSGLSESAFWLTLPCLTEILNRAGFVVQRQLVIPEWDGQGPRVHLAAVKQPSAPDGKRATAPAHAVDATGSLRLAEQQLMDAHATLFRLEHRLHEQATELDEERHRRAYAERVIEDLKGSVSWRLTTPLRIAKRRLRGVV